VIALICLCECLSACLGVFVCVCVCLIVYGDRRGGLCCDWMCVLRL